MSKNLVKSYFTTKESSTPRIINGNTAVEQAIERASAGSTEATEARFEDFGDGFEGLNPDVYEDNSALFDDGIDADMLSGLVDDDGLDTEGGAPASNVIKAVPTQDADRGPSEEDVRAEVEALRHRLIEETLADVAAMKDQAAEEVARDKAMAMEEARAQGYEEGARQAYAELEDARNELAEEKRKHEEEYEELLFELEPKFVRYLTNIYEKVFQVNLSEERDIVVNLLKAAMQKVEGSKNYMIHVSKDDYQFVYDRKRELAEAAMAEDAIIDVVEDITMKSGDCFIETANGIFDCGIETQLTALKKKLMLLAYDGR